MLATKKVTLNLTALESRALMATNVLGVASGYNGFFFNNYDASYSDVQGKLAAGGNVSLTGYSVGDKISNAGPELVVGGNLNFTNGQVDGGGVTYGGTLTTKWFGTNGGTISQKSGVVDFAAAQASLTSTSEALANKPSNGTVVNQWGGLILTGTSTGTNYFSLNASQLSSSWGITINAPAGSTVIVNVHGMSASMKFMGFQLQGGVTADHVLLNFVDAQSLVLDGVGIQGSILAPNANVKFDNGQINGTLVANSMCGYGQLNWVPPNIEVCGCLYNPTQPASLSGSISTSICGCGQVHVQLINQTTGAVVGDVMVSKGGTFSFAAVPPGVYKLTASRAHGTIHATAGNAGGNLMAGDTATIYNIDLTSGAKATGYSFGA
ncbi:choice-of-anchor A family protein [Telmatocola sphagniphila]|uniref:Choice-of-anchor A family protein n=1 Tax=Telmatocola sphagniphila TaxID=1123043 RepID=A0A8E6B952_9BACT|nr:collagen-binding domain-containing protein [Telmatocola sphagniphila]QVL33662.1 choice-of-anchor A family protein [Telmatocola sphagniphila]